MRVEVTEANIDRYGLEEITGETKEVLLRAATLAWHLDGHLLSIVVPDPPGESEPELFVVNVFEHFDSTPAVDGAEARNPIVSGTAEGRRKDVDLRVYVNETRPSIEE